MQLAAWDIEPVDGHLDDPCAGSSQCNKKFDIECKSLLAQPAADRLVKLAPYQLESTL